MGRIFKEFYYYFHTSLLLSFCIFLGLGGTVLGYLKKDALPPPGIIRPELQQAPAQAFLPAKLIYLSYGNTSYTIKDVADYSLRGLVVSHNNIASWTDIYHDKNSLNTKDICVIWGPNLENDHYLAATFKSGPWTCYYHWPEGKALVPEAISNNHLITDNPAIRAAIADLEVGDQVEIRGKLVNYKRAGRSDWRITSTSRKDKGGHACEIIFVEDLTVLEGHKRVWRRLYHAGLALLTSGLFLSLLAYLAV